MNTLLGVVRRALSVLVALIVLFEEWGWEPLQRLMAWIARLPGVRHLESLIARLPPWAALIVMGLPTLLLVPAKLAALWLLAAGHALLGVAAIVAAKVVGTAIVARLFVLTRPALMRLAWFAAIHARWLVWKEAVFARVRASWAWRVGRALKRDIVLRVRRFRQSL